MKEYRFPYHGLERSFRSVLLAPDGLFPGAEAPFCALDLIGQFIERLADAFEPERAVASLHVPVKSRGKWLTVHMDLEWQVALGEARLYDDADDAMIPLEQYTDGVVKLTKYDGPASWREADWPKATVAMAGMAPKQ